MCGALSPPFDEVTNDERSAAERYRVRRRRGPNAWAWTGRFLHLEPRKCGCSPGRGNNLLYEVLVEPRHSTVGGPQDEPPHRYAVDFTLKKKPLQRPIRRVPAKPSNITSTNSRAAATTIDASARVADGARIGDVNDRALADGGGAGDVDMGDEAHAIFQLDMRADQTPLSPPRQSGAMLAR